MLYIIYLLTDLSNMYKLLKPIHGGLGVLIQEVEGHIKQTGLEAVKSLKGDNVSYYLFHLQNLCFKAMDLA